MKIFKEKMFKVIFSLIFLLALLNSHCTNQNGFKKIKPYSSQRLQAEVEEYLKDKTEVLGTIVKVDINGKTTYKAASGYLDSSRTIPIEPNTKFIIGSITKIFTSVLVHQLMDQGEVKLYDPLINYLPPAWSAILEKIDYGNEITVEQALTHRSGIGDMTETEEFHKSLLLGNYKKLNGIDYIRLVQEKRRTKFKPGEDYDYSNSNYILLGALIENVSEISYGESLKKNILERIGLDNTFLMEKTLGSHQDTIAHGYTRIEDKLYDGREISVEWAQATGGIVSNADDLIKFFRELKSGSLFSSKKTYEHMSQLAGHNETYGRGLEIINEPDIGLYYGHKGSFLKTSSCLAYFPKEKMTICICHTYDDFSMSFPTDLMKVVIQSIRGDATTDDVDIVFEGPDILADTSNALKNEDVPVNGEWNFDLKEEWNLSQIDVQPLIMPRNLHVCDDGRLYLLLQGSAKVHVLDRDGNMMYSFGGHGDGPLFEYPLDLYVTSGYIHVLDMGRSRDRIKTYDKKGSFVKTSPLERGVSPRIFIDNDRYVAVRSSPDILNRPNNELLELLSLGENDGSVLAKFAAEDKLILETILPMGRYILLENDIDIFPRLILHFDKNMLYLGRSDKYVIKKIDLSGAEQLSFSITGREREALPPNYAVNLANRTRVGRDKEMPEEMKEKFITRFPDKLTFFTEITTDEQELIYVFVPNISDLGKQEIDIFSPKGRYLYHAVIELPEGLKRIRPLVLKGNHLYAIVEGEKNNHKLVKYGIKKPEFLND